MGSLHTVVRLRSQSGQSFTRIQLIMDLGISFLPGFSQLSHLVACIINVSLTYIYNALARKRVDKRNPPKRVLVISVTRYACYFYLNFPLLASIADFPIREVHLLLFHAMEQYDLYDTRLDDLSKIL